jgi:hypothetical protein
MAAFISRASSANLAPSADPVAQQDRAAVS